MAWFVRGVVATLSMIGVYDLVGEDLLKEKDEDLIGEYNWDQDPRGFGAKLKTLISNFNYSSVEKKALIIAIFYTIWKYQETLIKTKDPKRYMFKV